MRYTTGFFQSYYPSRQVQCYGEVLEKSQDDLGRLIDAAVADLCRHYLESNIEGLDLKIRKNLRIFASLKLLE